MRAPVLALLIAGCLGALHAAASRTSSRGTIVWGTLQSLEGRAEDLKFRLRGPRSPNPAVVVAVVDEASVRRYGRWPWPRDRLADALRRLHAAGARSVGLDITFSDEVAPSAGAAELAPTAQLAAALAAAPEVTQGVQVCNAQDLPEDPAAREALAHLLEPFLLTRLPAEHGPATFRPPSSRPLAPRFESALPPCPELARVGGHLGHFNVLRDSDGTLRSVPLFVELAAPHGWLPSLALQTAATYLAAQVELDYDPSLQGLRGARLRAPDGTVARQVPLEAEEPALLVNFVGAASQFPHVSLGALLAGEVPPAALAGKAVLVGTDVVGTFDQVVTPFADVESGIFTHASVLSNILDGRYLLRPWWLLYAELLFMLASALALAWLLPRASVVWKGVLVLGAVGLYLAVNQALFLQGLQAAVTLPVLNLLGCSVGILFLGYRSTDLEKSHLRHAFAHYLSPSVMEDVLAHPERLRLGGEKRELTCLFSDIRGFTQLSEQMAPEALVRFINGYLSPMTRVVLEHGGTLDKYIGDALMAFWGAPVPQEDHVLRACRAALGFLDVLAQLQVTWRREGLPELNIGVGIHTGPMVVGNMGSDTRFNYTVMGDAVNLASRLEGLNKQFGTRILLSAEAYARVGSTVTARRLGAAEVKGKSHPVEVFELLGLRPGPVDGPERLAPFEAALQLYEKGARAEARVAFADLLARWPDDGPSRYYADLLEKPGVGQ